MVHHFPHEINICHKDARVAFLEEEVNAFEAQLEDMAVFTAHHLCEVDHGFGGLGLIGHCLDL